MKFEIETAKLNNVLGKVSKGLGNSKVFPVTEYFRLNLTGNVLEVTATDTTNFIHVIEKGVEGNNGEVIIEADKLIKLVSKTTKEKMKFEFDGSSLVVKGNGTYKLSIFEGEEGFPEYEFDFDADGFDVKVQTIKDVFHINEASIAKEMIMPCLTGYNVGEDCVTTDGVKMCINATNISEERMLISQRLADLLHTLSAEDVLVQKDGNKILFTTDNIIIFGTELDGLDEYPDISGLAQLEYDNTVIISKGSLLNVLDRLSIFVDKFDNNAVRISFDSEKATVEDIKKNSNEMIGYVEASVEEQTEIVVNIEYLKDLLSVIKEPNVNIKFGEGLPVTIAENNVTQILSTYDAEQDEES